MIRVRDLSGRYVVMTYAIALRDGGVVAKGIKRASVVANI
jgi:hypothetical protein